MSRWKIPWKSLAVPQTITTAAQTTPRLTAKHIKAVIERGTYGDREERVSREIFDKLSAGYDNTVIATDDTNTYDNDQGVGSGSGTGTSGNSGGNVYTIDQAGISNLHAYQLAAIKDDGKVEYVGLTEQKPRPSKTNKNNFMYSSQALGEIFPSFHGFRGDTFAGLVTLAAGTLIFHSVGDILQVSYTINGQQYQQRRVIT